MKKSLQGNGETILLVDDERLVRNVGKMFLTRSGYQVIEADSGEEALSSYREELSRIALVILDINMPGMGGQKCMQELISMNPEVKIIVASGYSFSDRISGPLAKKFAVMSLSRLPWWSC